MFKVIEHTIYLICPRLTTFLYLFPPFSRCVGPYPYTPQLLKLEGHSSCSERLEEVQGFLPIQKWHPFLASIPDQQMAGFLERGIRYGFIIGFNRDRPLKPASSNMLSVKERPEIVTRYIAEEVAAGRLRPSPAAQISPIGLIPETNKPDKFRMIVDLSSPKGMSVNDKEACSFHYASVAEAARRIVACGQGALMAKLDLKSAYRMVAVHPGDSPLLGIQWDGTTYVDSALPFGLRSAPIIFSAMAAWALFKSGVDYSQHYLDDFFFCGPRSSTSCQEALHTAIPLCSRLCAGKD